MSLTVLNFILGCLVGFVGCIIFEVILLIYIAKKFQPAVVDVAKETLSKVRGRVQ